MAPQSLSNKNIVAKPSLLDCFVPLWIFAPLGLKRRWFQNEPDTPLHVPN